MADLTATNPRIALRMAANIKTISSGEGKPTWQNFFYG
jgi:hypothetical protein